MYPHTGPNVRNEYPKKKKKRIRSLTTVLKYISILRAMQHRKVDIQGPMS